MAILVAWVQGTYYLITGIWPLLSVRTFMLVTGPKTDIWLVKTVGVLVRVIGSILLLSASRALVPAEVFWLAVMSAAALTAIDLVYVMKTVISPIHLVDAAVEVSLILAWFASASAGDWRGVRLSLRNDLQRDPIEYAAGDRSQGVLTHLLLHQHEGVVARQIAQQDVRVDGQLRAQLPPAVGADHNLIGQHPG